MKYFEYFKTTYPREEISEVLDRWTSEMNQFAIQVAAEHSACSIAEGRTLWLMCKLAEIEVSKKLKLPF